MEDTPFGWAIEEFYEAKEYIKSVSNAIGVETYIGGIPFKAFSNLTTKWTPSSGIGQNLWVIRIDHSKDSLENSFPLKAATAFANKLAWGIIEQKIYPSVTVEVKSVHLPKTTINDLNAHFNSYSYDEAKDQIFLESIRPSNLELEALIQFIREFCGHQAIRNDEIWKFVKKMINVDI